MELIHAFPSPSRGRSSLCYRLREKRHHPDDRKPSVPATVAFAGGKIAVATRNAARAELLSLLRQLASYVTGNCNADLVLLLSSGFEPVKAPSPVGVLPAPENLRLSLTGISGQLHLRFDRVMNAANYSVQTAQTPDGPWEGQNLSTSTTPGKVYWVRAQANGTAGASGWGGRANAMVV